MGAAFSHDDNEEDYTQIIKDTNNNYSGYYFGNPRLTINGKRLLPNDVQKMLTFKKYLKYKEKYKN